MLRITLYAFLCLTMLSTPGVAAPPKIVERFDNKTWATLQQELPRPSAVVFTATYCANCPAIIKRLSDTLRARGLPQQVVAVVIDPASDQELLASKHYDSAALVFTFDGNEATLRYGVDPRWRGVTPYVALLGKTGKPRFVTGPPSDEDIETWTGKPIAND